MPLDNSDANNLQTTTRHENKVGGRPMSQDKLNDNSLANGLLTGFFFKASYLPKNGGNRRRSVAAKDK